MVIAALCAIVVNQTPTVTETSLGKAPAGIVENSITVSPANNGIAFVEKRDGKECVVVDGVPGKLYDAIPSMPLTEAGRVRQIEFSRDEARVGYTAKDGNKYRVVVNGEEGPAFERISVGAVDFSRDGKRWAYAAMNGESEYVVIDGVQSKPFDYVATDEGFFSLDSKHSLFYAERNKKRIAVQDGVEIADEHYHGHSAFFESGHATDVRKVGEKWVVYIDGMASKPYDAIGNNIEFSADGKRHLFQATDRTGDFLVVNGAEGKRFPSIDENSYKFTPDGRTVHVVKIAIESYVVIDDKPEASYDWVSEPTFNKDGTSMAYVAEKNDKRFVVHDGKKGKEYSDIRQFPYFMQNDVLIYSGVGDAVVELSFGTTVVQLKDLGEAYSQPGSKSVMFIGQDAAGWGAFLDHKRVANFDSSAAEATLSADTKHWAAWGKRGEKVAVVCDGREMFQLDEVTLVHLRKGDGSMVCIGERSGKLMLFAPEERAQTYDSIVAWPQVDGQDAVWFIAKRNGEFFRVKIG